MSWGAVIMKNKVILLACVVSALWLAISVDFVGYFWAWLPFLACCVWAGGSSEFRAWVNSWEIWED